MPLRTANLSFEIIVGIESVSERHEVPERNVPPGRSRQGFFRAHAPDNHSAPWRTAWPQFQAFALDAQMPRAHRPRRRSTETHWSLDRQSDVGPALARNKWTYHAYEKWRHKCPTPMPASAGLPHRQTGPRKHPGA